MGDLQHLGDFPVCDAVYDLELNQRQVVGWKRAKELHGATLPPPSIQGGPNGCRGIKRIHIGGAARLCKPSSSRKLQTLKPGDGEQEGPHCRLHLEPASPLAENLEDRLRQVSRFIDTESRAKECVEGLVVLRNERATGFGVAAKPSSYQCEVGVDRCAVVGN